ncbi:16S rRNA (cytidine(1402)-2'-O)-methyltransferase [Halomonas halmophila]|uniref:16S rRNA (cytidine(1402)-2'-O)-methyltransferase n=1 Tax=Halomonas halmophila TaxID=252 RepID=UPI0011425EA0|nr:16S rRNA (cytidine(1402)-2'-O)-methyltransferase [Halomonas halmophila]
MSDAIAGSLYVVATPIGNLEDLSPRAARLLGEVALVAAEDTRHTSRLLRHLGVAPAVMSLHEHNEAGRVEQIDRRLAAGEDVALVSDAGTPLISDPGFVLVRELRARQRCIVPVPGACALVAALSAAGLATDQFLFNGFLPAKSGPRRTRLEALVEHQASLVFYESPHRIHATLADLARVFGERPLVLARELTKTFETFLAGTADTLIARLEADPDQARGEFVIMVEGAPPRDVSESVTIEADALLSSLLAEGVGVKQAAGSVARLLGGARKTWYARAQRLKDGD